MERIEKNHWFVKDNNLGISLWKFYASIDILNNEDNVFYRLVFIDEDREELVFMFDTLEKCIFLVEHVASKCFTFEEILEKYDSLLKDDYVRAKILKM